MAIVGDFVPDSIAKLIQLSQAAHCDSISLPPGTVKIGDIDLDTVLNELERHGRVEIATNDAFQGGGYKCQCMTDVMRSTMFIRGFGKSRLEAALNCLNKLIKLKELEAGK